MTRLESVTLNDQSFCKSFGHRDEYAPIGWIADFSECHDEPQTFHDGQVDLIIPKQSQ